LANTLVDKSFEGIPKYYQLAKIIKDRIERQEYKGEEQIPSEAELCLTFQVSRITVREAINRLVAEGYLERRQGKGTYVAHQKLRRNIDRIYSFSSDMRHLGLEPSSRMLNFRIEECDPDGAELLRLPESNRKVIRISRLRLANKIPVLKETTLIPEYLCAKLEEAELEAGSLYKILTERYGLVLDHAEETYEAIIMPEEDVLLFGLDPSMPTSAFAIKNVTYLYNGTPIERTTSVGRGDLLTLVINMVSNEADFKRVIGV
jgi:GntR family transcriptional regulator